MRQKRASRGDNRRYSVVFYFKKGGWGGPTRARRRRATIRAKDGTYSNSYCGESGCWRGRPGLDEPSVVWSSLHCHELHIERPSTLIPVPKGHLCFASTHVCQLTTGMTGAQTASGAQLFGRPVDAEVSFHWRGTRSSCNTTGTPASAVDTSSARFPKQESPACQETLGSEPAPCR